MRKPCECPCCGKSFSVKLDGDSDSRTCPYCGAHIAIEVLTGEFLSIDIAGFDAVKILQPEPEHPKELECGCLFDDLAWEGECPNCHSRIISCLGCGATQLPEGGWKFVVLATTSPEVIREKLEGLYEDVSDEEVEEILRLVQKWVERSDSVAEVIADCEWSAIHEVLQPKEMDKRMKRWLELHGSGAPTCECNHDPPCDACKRSIEKYGCACQEATWDIEPLFPEYEGGMNEFIASTMEDAALQWLITRKLAQTLQDEQWKVDEQGQIHYWSYRSRWIHIANVRRRASPGVGG